MIQTDVKSAATTSSAELVPSRTRIKGVVVTASSSAGTVVLADGGSSGTTKLTINTPAAAGIFNVIIPGEGVLFESTVYATLTNASAVTVFYG